MGGAGLERATARRASSGAALSERDGRPDGALDDCVGVATCEAMHGLPARAVRWHQQLGFQVVEGGHRGIDDRLEHRAAEVEPADHRSDSRLARDPFVRVSPR